MNENDKLVEIALNNKAVVLSKLRRNLEAIDSLVKRGIIVKDQCRLSQPYVPGGKPESKEKKGQEATKSVFSR